jgi:hypothetical protein
VKAFLFLISLIAVQNLPAAEPFDAVKARLRTFETLKGRFSQSKRIQGIKRPLKSSGTFIVLRAKGVLWKTERPIQSLLVISKAAISVVKDGKKTDQISMKEQPALRLIGEVVFALFSADTESLKAHFKVTSSKLDEDSPWKLQLQPLDPLIARAIKGINLEGGSSVSLIQVLETNGDSSLVGFTEPRFDGALSDSEKALLD